MATLMAKADIYQVTESFVGTLAGKEIEYHRGEIVEGDDPALKRWPGYFGALEFVHRASPMNVEQATAAPGEKRGA